MHHEAQPQANAIPAGIAAPICALWLAIDTLDCPALHDGNPTLVAGVRAAVTVLQGMLGDTDENAMCQGLDELTDIVGLAPGQ